MNFRLKQLQLEHIALIKVSALLWNQYDIRTLVVEFSNSEIFTRMDDDIPIPTPQSPRRKEWQKIEDKVKENALQLMIPLCLRETLLPFIQAVGLQALKWLEYHRKVCNLDLNLPNEFCWTPQGIIDKKETSKFLINDESIHITTRYKLACFYCIEDDILRLWNKMNESDKISLYNNESTKNAAEKRHLDFWKYYITGELDMFRRKYDFRHSNYNYMLRCAVYNGNKAAVEYFLERVNSREASVLNTARYVANARKEFFPKINKPPKEYLSEILFFLLSQMKIEQQVKVFQKCYFKVMCSLLDWPFQSLYREALRNLLNFHPDINYDALLKYIIHKSHLGYKDYAYGELFRDLWQAIPNATKNQIVNDNCFAGLLDMLLWIKDMENFILVFQNTTVAQKQKFIFSVGGKNVCEYLIFISKDQIVPSEDLIVTSEDWDLFRFILKLCISSKEKMIDFKQQFEIHLQVGRPVAIEKSKLDECSHFLNNLIKEYDKRKCLDDSDSGPVKKLR